MLAMIMGFEKMRFTVRCKHCGKRKRVKGDDLRGIRQRHSFVR